MYQISLPKHYKLLNCVHVCADTYMYVCVCVYIYIYIHIYTYVYVYAAAAKSLQSYPTLWDPIDCRPPGSPIPGILHARTLEWVAISFSNA